MTYGLFIVPFNSAWLRIMPYKVGKIRSHLLGLILSGKDLLLVVLQAYGATFKTAVVVV